MSAIAAALKHMLAAGMPHDAIIAAVAEMETASAASVVRPSPPRQASDNAWVWVYVIAVDHPGDLLVRVGISQHPNHRMGVLSKERGYNLSLEHVEGPFSREVAFTIEQAAHVALAAQRERGEWFLCGAERAVRAVQAAATEILQ